MSKTHLSAQDDLDAELDQFLSTRKVKPSVQHASDEIDLFGGNEPVKKKSLFQRLLAFLNLA